MAELTSGRLSEIYTVEFSNGADISFPNLISSIDTTLYAPLLNSLPFSYGTYYSSDSYGGFATIPTHTAIFSASTYGGITIKTGSYNALPTSTTYPDSVTGGGYKIIRLGSWTMIGGWVTVSSIASGTTGVVYTFEFPLVDAYKFADKPSVCVQEENGFGTYAWPESNYTNTTGASCAYDSTSGKLTLVLNRAITDEAGTIVFFISGKNAS